MEETLRQLVPQLITWGIRVLGALVFLFAAWRIGAWLGNVISRRLDAARFDPTLTRFFARVVRWLVMVAALLAALGMFGINTTSFAAILGAAGLAVGLAFQGTLSNFASGVLLLAQRPFGVGDVVQLSGHYGTVDEVGIFTVVIDTFDNRRITIPNSGVFSGVIENLTAHATRRADVDVGVTYGADVDRTREVLETAARSVPTGLDEPEPMIVLVGLGDSAVQWQVRVWCNTPDWLACRGETVRAVKKHLEAEGLTIAFPQLDVHLDRTDPRAMAD